MNETAERTAKRILVVDDNPVILRALSLVLSARGYEVFTASDASEAFGFARLEKLDLIVLDLLFPPDVNQNGMTWNGLRMIEWMQRAGLAEGVPIVVVSGAEPERFMDDCLALGASAYFSKPINMSDLLECIQGLLNPQDAFAGVDSGLLLQPLVSSAAPIQQRLA
jgi:two-component system, OmpR family, KDP operon response regulator KdpE